MNKIKQAMQDYFSRLLVSCKQYGYEYPAVFLEDEDVENNGVIVSQRPDSIWYYWEPVEKNIATDLSVIEKKYNIKIHQDIKDYYNTFWFYKSKGLLTDCNKFPGNNFHNGRLRSVRLPEVIPGKETFSLYMHIEQYFRTLDSADRNLNNPNGDGTITLIGTARRDFIFINNITGEIYLQDRYKGAIKIADNLVDMINRIKTSF